MVSKLLRKKYCFELQVGGQFASCHEKDSQGEQQLDRLPGISIGRSYGRSSLHKQLFETQTQLSQVQRVRKLVLFILKKKNYSSLFVCSRNQFRVVGFIAEAKSVDFSQLSIEGDNCNIPSQVSPQFVNPKGTKLLFLYSVEWQESPVSWASRWDIYLGMSDVEIHWFSIINSLIVVFLLSGEFTFSHTKTSTIIKSLFDKIIYLH